MSLRQLRIVIISHASIKTVNRSVYRHLIDQVENVSIIIPRSIKLSSGKELSAEPAAANDPDIIALTLLGSNPRTYHYPDLITWLEKIKPNVVLLENDPVSKLGFQMSRWCKKANASIICQSYENLDRDIVTTLKNQGWKKLPVNFLITLLNRIIAPKIDALLVVNKESERIFKKYGYKNVCRIPLGYDKTVFFTDNVKRSAYRSKLKVTEDHVVVAYFGRMVPQKGVHLLIEALSELKDLNWMLLLDHAHDNESEYVNRINELIKSYHLDDKIIYFDANHIEIANYMRASDIMVAPSVTTSTFKEQYGRAVQEAMACGCVCLVSDSGHLKDIVEDNLLVFQEGNVAEIKDLLVRYISNTYVRHETGERLKQIASSRLTTEHQGKRLLELVEKIHE